MKFLIKDKTGRGEDAYTTTKELIEKTMDLDEVDYNDVTLREFLDEASLGDDWDSRTENIIRVK